MDSPSETLMGTSTGAGKPELWSNCWRLSGDNSESSRLHGNSDSGCQHFFVSFSSWRSIRFLHQILEKKQIPYIWLRSRGKETFWGKQNFSVLFSSFSSSQERLLSRKEPHLLGFHQSQTALRKGKYPTPPWPSHQVPLRDEDAEGRNTETLSPHSRDTRSPKDQDRLMGL